MKTLLARLTWVKIVEGSLLIVLGLLVGIIGGIKPLELSSALFICIAIFLFIDGIVTLIGFILDPKTNFSLSAIIGALFIAIGIVLCVPNAQDAINQIITVFVGGMLLATGAAYLTKSIMQCVYKAPIGWILINFLITAGCIALGVVSLVFYSQDPESSKTTMMVIYIILGTSITVLGIFDLIFAIQTHKLKQQESAVKGEQSETKIVDDEMIIVDGKVKAKKKRERKAKRLNMENKELPHQDNNNENQNPKDNNDSQN